MNKYFITLCFFGILFFGAGFFSWMNYTARADSGIGLLSPTQATTTEDTSHPSFYIFSDHIDLNLPVKLTAMIDMQGNTIKSADVENSTFYMVSPDHNCHILRVSNAGLVDSFPANCP